MEQLFVAEIVDTVKKHNITKENYKDRMEIYVTRLNGAVNQLVKKDLIDISNVERIRLIDYVSRLFQKRDYIQKTFLDSVNYIENELIKIFVSELIKHRELNKEVIQLILDNILNMLFLESQKEENKNLDYSKIYFFNELRSSIKEDKFGSIIDFLENNIRINLDFEFNLNHLDLINKQLYDLDRYDFDEIIKVLLDDVNKETLEKHYSLLLLKNKLLNDKKIKDKLFGSILYDLTEDLMKTL